MPTKYETRGKRPTYTDPKRLRSKVDEFFAECEENNKFASFPAMLLYLNISKPKYDELRDPEVNGKMAQKYQDIHEYAMLRRQDQLLQKMVNDPKMSTGCKAALAMPENGGFTERTAENQDRKINIRVSEENAELFK